MSKRNKRRQERQQTRVDGARQQCLAEQPFPPVPAAAAPTAARTAAPSPPARNWLGIYGAVVSTVALLGVAANF